MPTPVKRLAVAAFAAIGAFAAARAIALPPAPAAIVGQPAPAFGIQDIAGKTVRLGDYAGRTIVLDGPMTAARLSASTTTAATCRRCNASTRQRGSCG